MKSNTEWIKWGRKDPLFGVSSWQGREKGGVNPWTDEEFYALGQSDFADFISCWNSFGYDRAHCVEIGCGAGRITKYLAGAFDRVSALDVSEDQIEYARSHIDRSNVDYFKVNGTDIPLEAASATAVFSVHVFQHFDSEKEAAKVFREIHRVLNPGGTLMIHLPMHRLPKYPVAPLLAGIISLWKTVGTIKADLNRKAGKMIMRGLSYDRTQLAALLQTLGFTEIEFRAFQVKSNRDWHDVVLARK